MFFEESTNNKNVSKNNFIWVEKYRPNKLEDYLGNDHMKKTIQSFIDQKQIPHLLFHSHKPGTGKTTIAKLISNSIPCDKIYINASDENGIDAVRYKIKEFASTLGFNDLKILVLDEIDRATPAAQMALRNTMETFAYQTRFILTCNYVEKIIEPLISRCQVFNVHPPEKRIVAKHVSEILNKENVSYNVNDFKTLMKFYPDIRRIIQYAQQNSVSGSLNINTKQILESDGKIKLVEILKGNKSEKEKLKDCRQLLSDSGTRDFTEWYDYLYDNIDEFAPKSIAPTILSLSEYQYKDTFVVNKEMNFSACIIQILKGL